MSPIMPVPPKFNIEKEVNDIIQTLNISAEDDKKYTVYITDVEEKYIKWKYTPQNKHIDVFRILPSKDIAEQVQKELVEKNNFVIIEDGFDELFFNKKENCKNIFIFKNH